MIYALILILLSNPQYVEGTTIVVELFSQIINNVFENKMVCYITANTIHNKILGEALFGTQLFVVSTNALKHLTLDIPCNGYIMTINETRDFTEFFNHKKQYYFNFKPWTRILLIHDSPLKHTPQLQATSNNFALDIITVETQGKRDDHLNNTSYQLLIKSWHRNATLLSWSTSEPNQVDWTQFRPTKWSHWTHFANKGKTKAYFKIAMFHCPPFIYLDANNYPIGGVEYEIVKEVTRDWPLKYLAIKHDIVDNAWSHSINMVEDNISDIAVCSQWQMNAIHKNVDFTYPMRQICATFLVKKPQLLPDVTFMFQSFQFPVYVATFFTLMLVAGIFRMVDNFYNETNKNAPVPDYSIHLIYMVRVLSLGGIKNLPLFRLLSAKFIICFWGLYCLIFSYYYSAGMTSCLTNPRYTNNINTLEDMVDFKVDWVLKHESFARYFRSLNTPLFDGLADLYRKGDRITDRSSKSAILVKTIEQRYVSDIAELPPSEWKYYKALDECIAKHNIGFVLTKSSPFTRIFEKRVIRFVESGLFDYWIKMLIYASEKSQTNFFNNYVDDNSFLSIDTKKIQGAFFLLGVGHILSAIVFVIELFMRRKN